MTRLALLAALLLAGCSAQPAGNATPSAAPDSGTSPAIPAIVLQGQRGAPPVASSPAQLERLRVSTVGSGVGVRVESVPTDHLSGAPPLAAVIYSGRLAWASPSHGPRYLALREPVGTRVEICSMARCRERVSTDFGPIRSLWLSGRIADISAADFEYVCGMSAAQRIRHGLCPGSIRIISRPKIRLPQTSTEGP